MTRLFAELQDNIVMAVLVVDEENCVDINGQFDEQIGIDYLNRVYRPGTFLETRVDGSIRRFFASVNGTYVPDKDEFRPPQPADNWIWDDEHGQWVDPDPRPLVTEETTPDQT